MAGIGQNPALKFVKEIRETRSLEEMAAFIFCPSRGAELHCRFFGIG